MAPASSSVLAAALFGLQMGSGWADACQTVRIREDNPNCSDAVAWARNTGLREHPEYYQQNLTSVSPFELFQAELYRNDQSRRDPGRDVPSNCSLPCAVTTTASPTTQEPSSGSLGSSGSGSGSGSSAASFASSDSSNSSNSSASWPWWAWLLLALAICCLLPLLCFAISRICGSGEKKKSKRSMKTKKTTAAPSIEVAPDATAGLAPVQPMAYAAPVPVATSSFVIPQYQYMQSPPSVALPPAPTQVYTAPPVYAAPPVYYSAQPAPLAAPAMAWASPM